MLCYQARPWKHVVVTQQKIMTLYYEKNYINSGHKIYWNKTHRNINLTSFMLSAALIVGLFWHRHSFPPKLLSIVEEYRPKNATDALQQWSPSKMYHIALRILRWRKKRPLTTYSRFHSAYEKKLGLVTQELKTKRCIQNQKICNLNCRNNRPVGCALLCDIT
jgi:hypothetical protein